MKVCIATSGPGGIKDYVSPVFGRSPSFTIIDIDSGNIKNIKAIENPGFFQGSGAGIIAAQTIINEKCDVVIAGSFGPNSMQILMIGRIDVRLCAPMPCEKALEMFQKGLLTPFMPLLY